MNRIRQWLRGVWCAMVGVPARWDDEIPQWVNQPNDRIHNRYN